MSGVNEHDALDRRLSLYDHAMLLHRRDPGAPLVEGGCPLPDADAQPDGTTVDIPESERRASLLAVLGRFFDDSTGRVEALHDQLLRPDFPRWSLADTVETWPAMDTDRVRQAGVWLVRNATDRRPASIGLALLIRAGRAEDASVVRTLGLLGHLGVLAVHALAAIGGPTSDLVWLAQRSVGQPRESAIRALCQRTDPVAVAWLLRHVADQEELASSHAREIAELLGLADVLRAEHLDGEIVDQAGRLLLDMVAINDHRTQLGAYADACRTYSLLVRHIEAVAPSVDRFAMVVSLAEELRTGRAACLSWDPGQRADLVARLGQVLRRPDWAGHLATASRSPDRSLRWRASWAGQAAGAVGTTGPVPSELGESGTSHRLGIAVVVPDPTRRGDAEARILVDGRPVVAAAFDKGSAFAPEHLLGAGRLRATDQPQEVRLAEAYCTEGCCGALYVTIMRDGNTVVWHEWRGYTGDVPPPSLRFDATHYDETIAAAETDHTWEWPARTLTRLLGDRLHDQPDLLARWQCHLEWIGACSRERGRARLMFCHPERPDWASEKPWLQFECIIAVNDTETPADQVARIVASLCDTDPRTQAVVVGGDRDYAEQLGFPWPARRR